MCYNLLVNGVYWGYRPFTNFLGHPRTDHHLCLDQSPLHLPLKDGLLLWTGPETRFLVGPNKKKGQLSRKGSAGIDMK